MSNDFEHRKCCFDKIDRLNRENAQLLNFINKQRKKLIELEWELNGLAHDIVHILQDVVYKDKDDDIIFEKQLYLLDTYSKKSAHVSDLQDLIRKYEHHRDCNFKVIDDLKEHLNIYD